MPPPADIPRDEFSEAFRDQFAWREDALYDEKYGPGNRVYHQDAGEGGPNNPHLTLGERVATNHAVGEVLKRGGYVEEFPDRPRRKPAKKKKKPQQTPTRVKVRTADSRRIRAIFIPPFPTDEEIKEVLENPEGEQ